MRGWPSTTARSREPSWALAEADAAWPLDLGTWPGLEAQIAAIADDIAYDNHDIDDGLRSGILKFDELIEVPLVRRHWQAIDARHPGLDRDRAQRALVRDMIGTMVGDVLAETRRRVGEAGVATVEDVRAAGRQLAGFSDALWSEEQELKRFLYANSTAPPSSTPCAKKRIASSPTSPPPIATTPLCSPRAGQGKATKPTACAASATSSPA